MNSPSEPVEQSSIYILHLEDSMLDAELIQERLSNSSGNYQIIRVFNRQDFMQALENHNIDLILADYNVPGFNGFQAMELARDQFPEVPFIFVSGALGEEKAVELLKGGASDYVLKDNLSRLETVVTRALAEKTARMQQRTAQDEVRQAKDDAEKASTAKSNFLSRMSHELRTPLNAILGYAQLAQADPMSEEQQHCTIQIMKAGQHLLGLINEILDISRIESGHMQLKMEAVDATLVIRQAVDLVKPMARQAEINLYADSGPCSRFVMGDADRLTQVLINLVSNAVKYNQRGGSVFVECHDLENCLRICVRDTGPGIPLEKQARLFVPFDRLDVDTSSAAEGTGLGLAVSKGLIEAMHGKIGVDSPSADGCIFWVELPIADKTAIGKTAGNSDTAVWREQPVSDHQLDILLVEENPVNADFMERVFRRRKHLCLASVPTGRQALDYMKNYQPDLLLADIHISDMPGEELVATARENFPQLPILVVTAQVDEVIQQKIREAGADAFLAKPVNVEEMFQVITELVNSKARVS